MVTFEKGLNKTIWGSEFKILWMELWWNICYTVALDPASVFVENAADSSQAIKFWGTGCNNFHAVVCLLLNALELNLILSMSTVNRLFTDCLA